MAHRAASGRVVHLFRTFVEAGVTMSCAVVLRADHAAPERSLRSLRTRWIGAASERHRVEAVVDLALSSLRFYLWVIATWINIRRGTILQQKRVANDTACGHRTERFLLDESAQSQSVDMTRGVLGNPVSAGAGMRLHAQRVQSQMSNGVPKSGAGDRCDFYQSPARGQSARRVGLAIKHTMLHLLNELHHLIVSRPSHGVHWTPPNTC